MSDVARLASRLREAHAVAVITGARISAESGMPTFRGSDGLWRSFRPEDSATPLAFDLKKELPTSSSSGALRRPAIEAAL
jgi:NAD-dependent deacetylase